MNSNKNFNLSTTTEINSSDQYQSIENYFSSSINKTVSTIKSNSVHYETTSITHNGDIQKIFVASDTSLRKEKIRSINKKISKW